MTDQDTLVLMGAVLGAFGVRGEVRARAFTAAPQGLCGYGPLYDKTGRLLLTPKRWRPIEDAIAITAPEVKDRDDAEALKGAGLFVPRAALPAAEEDEFYHVDLIGCRAETLPGEALGVVAAVQNFGAGDLLEIAAPNGKTLFVAFTKQDVLHVDVAQRLVILAAIDDAGDEA
jgi:16S rRNA processing protein RimM